MTKAKTLPLVAEPAPMDFRPLNLWIIGHQPLFLDTAQIGVLDTNVFAADLDIITTAFRGVPRDALALDVTISPPQFRVPMLRIYGPRSARETGRGFSLDGWAVRLTGTYDALELDLNEIITLLRFDGNAYRQHVAAFSESSAWDEFASGFGAHPTLSH